MSDRQTPACYIACLLLPLFSLAPAIAQTPSQQQTPSTNPYQSTSNPHYWKNKKPYEGYW